MYRSGVAEEFEDGEIMDSDHEENTRYLPVIQQQKINIAKQIKPPFPKKLKNSSDSESDNEGVCSDDEEDGISQINKVNSSRNAQPKNKYSIWSSVMQDELLSSELTSWSGVNKMMNSDRNVESYAIDLEQNVRRPFKRQREESNSMDESCEEETNLVDLETFGVSEVSDSSKNVLPSRKTAKVRRLIDQTKINKVTKSNNKEMFPINAAVFQSESSIDDIVSELLMTLREPPQMREIFTLAVTTIGVERIYKLLRATEDIEGAGGIMIVKGYRRRTPGGVFLHLLKSQSTKEEQSKIFVQDRNEKQDRKKMKKQMIDQKFNKLAAMVSRQTKSEGTPNGQHSNLMDENELFDANLDTNDIELDFI